MLIHRNALLCSMLAVAGCGGDLATPTGSQDPLYGLGTQGKMWPGGNVPVCFTNINDSPTLQQKIPGILANSWTAAANIHFSGFGACSGGGNQVSISFKAGSFGATWGLGYGARSVELISDDTSAGLMHFQYEVIHELGHALGFDHEQQRPDNWVNGVANQCGDSPSDSKYSADYAPQSGGLYLTANYDTNSIMNYCDPNGYFTTQLSVGDILGVSSPGAYGPSTSCTFPSGRTACNLRSQLRMEETWSVPAGCPASSGWILTKVGGGNIPLTTSVNDPKMFTLGWQAEGGVTAGPAIGSTAQYMICDTYKNCSLPFYLTISDCGTQVDNLYVPYNTTLYVVQGEQATESLEMTGPWINSDEGINAIGAKQSTNLPGASWGFTRGYSNSNTTCFPYGCVAFVDMTVAVPLSTPPGSYTATVSVLDITSNITRTATVPIQVGACTPPPSSCTPGDSCGTFTGCGRTLDCGTCVAGKSCTGGHCCPTGEYWLNGACEPPACNCPLGYYCDAWGGCSKNITCRPGTCQ